MREDERKTESRTENRTESKRERTRKLRLPAQSKKTAHHADS